MKIYVLHHTNVMFAGTENEREDVKLLGVYSSRENAHSAIERFRGRTGFAETPDGFDTDEYTLDQDYWVEGYVTIAHD